MTRRLRVAAAWVVGPLVLFGSGALASLLVSTALLDFYDAGAGSLMAFVGASAGGCSAGMAVAVPLLRPVMDRLLRWAHGGAVR